MRDIVAIAGYARFQREDPLQDERMLSRMAARLCQDRRTSPDDELISYAYRLFDGRFGLAAIVERHVTAADVLSQLRFDPRMAVAAIGDVWSTGSDAPPNSQPCVEVIRQVADQSFDVLNRVNGVYSAVVYDDAQREVRLYGDRLGLMPLYYYRDSGLFLFGTRIQSLLDSDCIPRTLSDEVIGQQLYFGFVPSDDTYIRGVHRVPGGSVVSSNARTLSIHRYWAFEYPDDGPEASLDDYSDECYALLRQAARRISGNPDDTGVLLSGGLDSRVTLGTMVHEKGPRFVACTYGLGETTNIAAARQIAAALGCRHETLLLRCDAIVADLLNLLVASDFLVESRSSQALEVMRRTKATAANWFTGGYLEATLGGTWLGYGLDRAGDDVVTGRVRCMTADDGRFQAVVGDKFGQMAREAAIAAWQRSRERPGATSLESAFERFAVEYRHRGWYVAAHALHRPNEQRFLMCDYDLLDFFLRVPADVRQQTKLYTHMIRKKWPELSHVVYANTGAPVGEPPSAKHIARKRRSRSIRRLARSVGLGRLFGPSPYVSADKAFTFGEHRDVHRLMTSVLLSPRALARAHIVPEGVKQLVSGLQGSASGVRLLFRLLRTELMIRSAVEGDREIFGEYGLEWHATGPGFRVDQQAGNSSIAGRGPHA